MFRGSFEHTLDNKGRLSIPSKFRDVLVGKGDDRIVMTNFVIDGQRCLDAGFLFVAVGADTGMLVRGSDTLAAKFKK